MNPIGITELNVITKAVKALDENIGEAIYGIQLSKVFINETIQTKLLQETLDLKILALTIIL